jgi:hypothetical protein
MGYTMASLSEAINNPLQAFGLSEKKGDVAAPAAAVATDLPYRPAQPNAN